MGILAVQYGNLTDVCIQMGAALKSQTHGEPVRVNEKNVVVHIPVFGGIRHRFGIIEATIEPGHPSRSPALDGNFFEFVFFERENDMKLRPPLQQGFGEKISAPHAKAPNPKPMLRADRYVSISPATSFSDPA